MKGIIEMNDPLIKIILILVVGTILIISIYIIKIIHKIKDRKVRKEQLRTQKEILRQLKEQNRRK